MQTAKPDGTKIPQGIDLEPKPHALRKKDLIQNIADFAQVDHHARKVIIKKINCYVHIKHGSLFLSCSTVTFTYLNIVCFLRRSNVHLVYQEFNVILSSILHISYELVGWCDGSGQLSVPDGTLTNLDNSRTEVCCACSKCG